jgi:tripartite-type tricarboxylate transporter receptor subunit TctC
MGRPYLAPPGLPHERAAVLQQAFEATMKDPEFLADAKKEKLEINPVYGHDIEELLHEAYGTAPAIAAKAGKLANSNHDASTTGRAR